MLKYLAQRLAQEECAVNGDNYHNYPRTLIEAFLLAAANRSGETRRDVHPD